MRGYSLGDEDNGAYRLRDLGSRRVEAAARRPEYLKIGFRAVAIICAKQENEKCTRGYSDTGLPGCSPANGLTLALLVQPFFERREILKNRGRVSLALTG